ncbi:MAG: hypothetical protein ACKN9V_02545 [Pseudomonadota bacterium]
MLKPAPMKNLKTLLILGHILSNILFGAVIIPPLFKATHVFEIFGENPKEAPKALVEHLSFGEKNPALLSIENGKKVFLMSPPRVDRCGFLHFEGNAVSLEKKGDQGDELRFYEQSLKIDISCHPIPFPRCGTFRSTESASSGEYLMEQLTLLKAQCQAQLVQGERILESYEIHLP